MPSQKTLEEYMKKQTQSTQASRQTTNQYKYRITGFYKETRFQETAIGKIPSEWKIVKLAIIFSEVNKKSRVVNINDYEPYKLITVKLYSKGVVLREIKLGKDIKTKVMFKVKAGDFIFSKIDARNGAYGFVPPELDGAVISADFPILELNRTKAVDGYVQYYMSQPMIWETIKNYAIGTTNRKRINVKQFLELVIPLPPLEEQWGVAEVLSTVDRAIEVVDGVVARLERLKKALMRELLTGRVRVREENGKLVFHRETEFQETPIGKIPKEWKIVKLKDICEKIKAGGTPPTSRKEFYNGDTPFVKIEDITNTRKYLKHTSTTITKAGLENSNAWLVPPKSLLFAMYGSIGAIAINDIPVATNQAILAIVPNREKSYVEFLYYLLIFLKPYFEKYAKRTTQANLTAEIVREFKIPLPPLQEQKNIAEILSAVDRVIELYYEKRKRLERLKRGLMDLLLTGRVKVRVKCAA